jgi:hypothetical protein
MNPSGWMIFSSTAADQSENGYATNQERVRSCSFSSLGYSRQGRAEAQAWDYRDEGSIPFTRSMPDDQGAEK